MYYHVHSAKKHLQVTTNYQLKCKNFPQPIYMFIIIKTIKTLQNLEGLPVEIEDLNFIKPKRKVGLSIWRQVQYLL